MKQQQIFISHSSVDAATAKLVSDYLERDGKRCWMAPRDIPAGTEYGEEIIKGLESSDAFVLIYSSNSNESQHVLREVERAVTKKIPLIAFKIDNSTLTKSMEYFLLANQWLDATNGTQQMLEPLSKGLDVLLSEREQHRESSAVPNTIRVSNKAVPAILSVIALGIVAIAIVIAVTSGKDELPVSVGTQSSETVISSGGANETVGTSPTAETSNETAELPEFIVGDFVTFGRYAPEKSDNISPVKWQIVDIDENNGTIRLISAEILDIKPFDCAESGKFDKDRDGNSYDRTKADTYTSEQMRQFRGSNDWASSDLRAWLNSDGVVKYYNGIVPTDRATDECGNAFGNQLGFLSSFTKAELAALTQSAPSDDGNERVTLLSLEEVEEYALNEKFILNPSVTPAAIQADETSWYSTYYNNGVPDYIWVTKTANDEYAHKVCCVESSIAHERYCDIYAAASGFGIRPVITLNLSALDPAEISGDGSIAAAYELSPRK